MIDASLLLCILVQLVGRLLFHEDWIAVRVEIKVFHIGADP